MLAGSVGGVENAQNLVGNLCAAVGRPSDFDDAVVFAYAGPVGVDVDLGPAGHCHFSYVAASQPQDLTDDLLLHQHGKGNRILAVVDGGVLVPGNRTRVSARMSRT